MKKFNLFSKLKEQKGATGVDIVVSITVIVVTIAVVTAIYANVDLTSKRVQRTAGATRIATNMLEQIDKMYYTEFLEEINKLNSPTVSSYITRHGTEDHYTIMPKNAVGTYATHFKTKIPRGYTVTIHLKNNYGSTTGTPQYDMVRDIKIEVKFPVGDHEESIKLSGSKAIEIVPLGNPPVMPSEDKDTLKLNFYNNVLLDWAYKKYFDYEYVPIKKVGSEYVKTTVDDKEWYNYESKIWPKIAANISSVMNGDYLKKDSAVKSYIFVWVPSYGKNSEGKLKFRYNETYYQIISKDLVATDPSMPKRRIFTVDTVSPLLTDIGGLNFEYNGKILPGCWVRYTDYLNDTDFNIHKDYAKYLKNSEYGPMEELGF